MRIPNKKMRVTVTFNSKRIIVPFNTPNGTVSQFKAALPIRLKASDLKPDEYFLTLNDGELFDDDIMTDLVKDDDHLVLHSKCDDQQPTATCSSAPVVSNSDNMMQISLRVSNSQGWVNLKFPQEVTIGDLRLIVLKREGKDNQGYICQLFTDEMPIFHSEQNDKVTLQSLGIKNGDNLYAFIMREKLQSDMYKMKNDTKLFSIDDYWRIKLSTEVTDKSLAVLLSVLAMLKYMVNSDAATLPKSHVLSLIREKFDFPPAALAFYRIVFMGEAMQFEKALLCEMIAEYMMQLLPDSQQHCLFDYSSVFFFQMFFNKDPSEFNEEFFDDYNLMNIFTTNKIEKPVYSPKFHGGTVFDEETLLQYNLHEKEKVEYLHLPKLALLIKVLKSLNLGGNYPSYYSVWKGIHKPCMQHVQRWTDEVLSQQVELMKCKNLFVPLCYTTGEKIRGKKTLALDKDGFTVLVMSKEKSCDEKDETFAVIDPYYGRATLNRSQFSSGESFLGVKKPVSKVERENKNITQIDMVLIDTSSSMSEKLNGQQMTKFESAKAYLSTFFDKLESYDLPHAVGIVSFDSNMNTTFKISTNFDHATQSCSKLSADGSQTRIFEAIKFAAKQIENFEKENQQILHNHSKRLLCFTDGEDTTHEDPFALVKILKDSNIVLDCVPSGNPAKFSTIKALCYATGGVCCLVNSSKESITLFQSEGMLELSEREKTALPNCQSDPEFKGLRDDKKFPMHTQVKFKKPALKNRATTANHETTSSQQDTKLMGMSRRKRIMHEFSKVRKETGPFSAYMEVSNLEFWKIVYKGPVGTSYANKYYLLYVHFPEDYPNQAPQVRFETKVYHCNVNDDGKICHQILTDCYSPIVSLTSIFKEIDDMMINPNFDSALDSLKGQLYKSDQDEYKKECCEWVEKYGFKTLEAIEKEYNLGNE